MNFTKSILIGILAFGLLSGCASLVPSTVKDIEIKNQNDGPIDLSRVKSYAWGGSATIIQDTFGQAQLRGFDITKEVEFLTNQKLREFGLSEVSSNPDVIVVYGVGINMDKMEEVSGDGKTTFDNLKNVPRGALVIVIKGEETGQTKWVGAARSPVRQDLDDATVKLRLKYAIDQMFKDFGS